MRSGFHRMCSQSSAVLGATLLLSFGPPAWRTIEQVDLLLVQISLELCQVGLAVLRACGV
jgi:hypothetical protein